MFLFIIFVFLLLFIILILFSFPQFSPIPYFPTNAHDLSLIVKTLHLKNNQILCDLGAGDGTVIFAAAKESWRKKLDTHFVGIEMNPALVFILHLKRLFHPNRKNIKIIWSDMFMINLKKIAGKKITTFYLYVSPKFLEKIYFFVKKSLPKAYIVSYMYPVKSLKYPTSKAKGKNFIYRYN